MAGPSLLGPYHALSLVPKDFSSLSITYLSETNIIPSFQHWHAMWIFLLGSPVILILQGFSLNLISWYLQPNK